MRHLTIRNVSSPLAKALEKEKMRSGKSLNQTVLEILQRALGVNRSEGRRGNGLRELAGAWTREQADEFDHSTTAFEVVDEDLWR